jgi:hypothetical protein
MQLDDNCTVDQEGSVRLRSYRMAYRDLASEMGVRLASEDNPSKAFAPSKTGEILGLIYNGTEWTWKMPDDKSDRLLVLLGKGIREGQLMNKEAMCLAGKINHYSNLVAGKFERCLIIHVVEADNRKGKMVEVNRQARVAMVWWLLNMRALTLEGSFIPDPEQYFLQSALMLYPDAAGGATKDNRKGWGCVNPDSGEYARGIWPGYILKNSEFKGERWGKRLTILEGFGAAQAMSVWVEDIRKAGAVAIMVDNSGFVWGFSNGCSRDEYIYTLAKYIQVRK